MRPIQLTLSGINSFLEPQTVEFEALLSRGLFGIFGPTGSGKSTLIDAMILALYGQNSLPRNTKDFVHTEADAGQVKFEFSAGSGSDRQVYCVERQFKRSSTGITTKLCRLTYDKDGELTVIDKTKEVDDALLNIIGLNQDQFLRTVVLPQGKFSEFIQLEPKDRRKMLEEIFRLERYGDQLANKIRAYKSEKDGQLNVLKGKWEGLEGVSEDQLEAMSLQIQTLQTSAEQATQLEGVALKAYEAVNRMKAFVTQRDHLQKEEAAAQIAFQELGSKALELAMALSRLLQQTMQDQQSLTTQLSALETALQTDRQQLDTQLADLTALEDQLKGLVFDAAQYEALTQAVSLTEERKRISDQVASSEKLLQDCEATGKGYREAVKLKQEAVQALEKDLLVLEGDHNQVAEQRDQWFTQRGSVEMRFKFAELMGNIQEGQPCPLCGQLTHGWDPDQRIEAAEQEAKALEHQWQAHYEVLLKQLQDKQTALQALKLSIKAAEGAQKTAEGLLTETQASWKVLKSQRDAAVDQLKTLDVKYELLRGKWLFEDPSSALEILKQQQRENEALQEKRATQFKVYQGLDEALKKKNTQRDQLLETERRLTQKAQTMSTLLDSVRHQYTLADADLTSVEKAGSDPSKGQPVQSFETLEKAVAALETTRKQCEGVLAQHSGSLKTLEMQVAQLELDTKQEAARMAMQGQPSLLARVSDDLQQIATDETLYHDVEREKNEIQERVKSLTITVATLQSEQVKMAAQVEQKKLLATEMSALEREVAKATLLAKLFKGGRFVEFVAMTELKYILREASMRLMDMTGSRYSLEVDSKGTFMICDHYEGGVRRDLRSLSGGETFIAALCLALSMSSRVQHKGRTTLELFLLDEGFGTLDERLLDVVMSSLEKLHDERVAVGLISHVEELKGRVPVKLEVTPAQAGVRGSTVKVTYQ